MSTDDGTTDVAAAWRARRYDLADRMLAGWVNRSDVWGAYISPGRRPAKVRADGTVYTLASYTAPPVRLRGKQSISRDLLARHFAGDDGGHVLGLHTTDSDNTSRWGAVEVDRHGDDGDPDANLRASLHWYDGLTSLGMTPLLSESNGAGGYHLRVVFERPAPTERVYDLLKWVSRDWAAHGLRQAPETFPKQARLPAGKCGNWLRLPGRHHTRPHWSRFWTEAGWVGGTAAVELLLSHKPDPIALIPEIPKPPPKPVVRNAPEPRSFAGGRMTDREVALKALDGIPNGGCHYDTWLAVGAALHSVDSSASMLAEWVAWSRQSGKHTEGECERTWPYFSASRERPVTVATLVWMARQAGREVYPGAGTRQDERPRRGGVVGGPAHRPAPAPVTGARVLPVRFGWRFKKPRIAMAYGGAK